MRPTLTWMGALFDSPAAAVMILAIMGQESGFRARAQVGGPALSFAQFELAGVRGVFDHPKAGPYAKVYSRELAYSSDDLRAIHVAMRDNDVLACAVSRLALYADPRPLPDIRDEEATWALYARVWRPGRPRRVEWGPNLFSARQALGF